RRATAELPTSRCTETSPCPCRWKLPAVWKSAESSASRSQPRFGAIAASSFRRSSESDTLELEQSTLVADAERSVRAHAVRGDDAMAREQDRDPVARAEGSGGAVRVRVARERSELAVRDRLGVGHGAECLGDRSLERRAPVEVELDVA